PLASGEDLNKRIETALGGFTHIEVLPARMILYDGRRDLKVLEEKIMAYPWSKQLPFLHFPKVEILNSEAVTKSVAIAGGTQMGGKIDLSEGIEIIETKRLASSEPVVVEDVGTQQEEVMLENEITPELEEIGAEEAGFVQEGNIGKLREMEEISPPPAVSLPKISHKFDFKSVLPKIKIPNFRFNLPNVSHGALILIPIILLILGGIGAFLYFIPKAKVYVYVTPQDFNKEMVSTVSGQTVDVTEIGSKKGVATGKKLVGEKAHGTVTIYSSSVSKTFVAGTTFTAANGLKFSLTSDVAIASGSGAASQVTATGNLTAVDIGDNYNLPSGTLFTIGGFPSSSYQAKNDSSFSGGNSHEATVVTKLDQDRLLATLSAELTATAKNDLNSKLMVGQTLLPNAITSTVSKKRFSKDVDTEAETFSVDLTIDFKGITVSSDDLISQFVEKYSVDIPKGYSLDRTSANPQINSVKMDKAGNAMLSVSLRSKLLPQLNVPDLRDRIAGRSSKTAGEVITKETGVSRVVIEAEPKFFQKLLEFFLPFKPENISLEIVSE
ncbi:baseplate J/gp47 family protein, partial [Candidatus Microgenomates bacterium]|nr:baseplate J/gp47 family protein [Candidatus Microgenomates bacterium]